MMSPPDMISGVYPRVCGGTAHDVTARHDKRGLSPRVRGNRLRGLLRNRPAGSIPACAGEPRVVLSQVKAYPVYPRVCGGTNALHIYLLFVFGLSPRVRGNRGAAQAVGGGHGSIPACAGEPSEPFRRPTALKVYPRVCGGTNSKITQSGNFSGLSPRVRGNHARLCPLPIPIWSIPACAGEPPYQWPPAALRQVYPRVCGGTHAAAGSSHGSHGLSPRVRGNLANGG